MSEGSSAPSASPVAAPEASSAPAEQVSQSSPAEGSAPSPEAIQDAVDSGEISQADAKNLIKKYKLKVRGKEVEREIDLGDDDYVRNQLQLAEMSRTSMQESAELKKMYQAELQRLKQNPWQVLQELGMDPDSLAESRIEERINEMKKSPDQLEKEKLQKEMQSAKDERDALKAEKQRLEMEQLQSKATNVLVQEIEGALKSSKFLPQNQKSQKRIADAMHWAIENGFEDVTAADVIPMVEKDFRDEISGMMNEAPEDLLEQYIGQQNLERMRKKRLAARKAAPSVNEVTPTTQSAVKQHQAAAQRSTPESRQAAKDFFRNLGKK